MIDSICKYVATRHNNEAGLAASYKEIRLEADFGLPGAVPGHLPKIPDHRKNPVAGL